jgi:CubicO group peptidase (beta-lactamase class C family)
MFPRRFQCCLAAAFFVLAAASPYAQTTGASPERAQRVEGDLDAYVARVLATFDVPGVSVAVVKDGKVVVAKGYGVRKLGAPEPVDARTLFGIASNTKVMTATALGLLVEEG